MAKKQFVQKSQQSAEMPQYDEQTMAFIEGAKKQMAMNHGLALDRDPAEVMKENNAAIREAARAITKKRGMVKQQPVAGAVKQPAPVVPAVQPEVVQPVQHQTHGLTDAEMAKVGYDALMKQAMRAAPEPELIEPEATLPEPEAMTELDQVPRETITPNMEATWVPPQVQVPPAPEKPKAVASQQQRPAAPQTAQFPRTEVTNFSDVRGLPSEGLLYESTIFGQSLTFMDILMMNNMDGVNTNDTINTLFDRRFRGGWEDGFNAENILQCDEAYLMHWLRASTIDDPLPYVPPSDKWEPYKCPECGKVATKAEDYAGLDIRFQNLDFKIQGDLRSILAKHANGCYTFELEDQRQCDVYLRRRYHARMINEAIAKYKKDTGEDMSMMMQFILSTAVVVEIEGMDTIVDKLNYIGGLGYKSAKHFLSEVNDASLVTDITAKVVCPFCHKEVTIPYPFRLDFYLSSL